MKLNDVAEAYEEQRAQPRGAELSFAERVGLLLERQWLWRETRALVTRLRHARLKQPVCLEDLDFSAARELKRAHIDQLGRQGETVATGALLVIGSSVLHL
jgi:DNA replication protein DnaC